MRDCGIEIEIGCIITSVSKSGYCKWLRTADELERDHDDYLLIKELFEAGKAKHGIRTITMKLKEQDTPMNHKKVARIMRKYGLITKIRQQNPYKAIMKKSLEHRTFENTLDRSFDQTVPYTVFCTDITYLPYNHRFAYLSVIKDIASGEIVAWHLSQHLEMELVINTLNNLKRDHRLNLKEVLIHSDQGFHYTNPLYIDMVSNLAMVQSMSRKGACIDNAPIESFFGHLKDEVEYQTCKTFAEVHAMIEAYMEYYNNGRHQWAKQKMTPIQYRDHLLTLG
jgi:transposase InsO family protein